MFFMMDAGLVLELTDSAERPPHESERRRYFRITEEGLSALAAETDRLSELVNIARAKMVPSRAASK